MTEYEQEARRAVEAYHAGKKYKDYPEPKMKGYCGRAARALWESTHDGHAFPYRAGSATLMEKAAAKAGKAIHTSKDANAYHKAVGIGMLKVGTQLYLPYVDADGNDYGHVVTVVRIGNPLDLASVIVFENTSSRRGIDRKGPGTVMSTLKSVVGAAGSNRIYSVVNV